MKQSALAFKRCRPLLGTFVEISLDGAHSECSEIANDAYQAIESVASLMSFHDPKSELSRLNQTPVGHWVQISDPLREVLELALRLQRESKGVFNVAIAQPLMFWDLLPGKTMNSGWKFLSRPGFELRDKRARRILPVQIDLGGIAKGYAVDRAVEAVQARSGKISGCVNAGGDMRVFGKKNHLIWIRSETKNRPVLRSTTLRNRSLATSSVQPRDKVSAYVDISKKKPALRRRTASVIAERCVVADALTKLALLGSVKETKRIAKKFDAEVSFFP
jgi:thiamine biosynthesis lipoprotein